MDIKGCKTCGHWSYGYTKLIRNADGGEYPPYIVEMGNCTCYPPKNKYPHAMQRRMEEIAGVCGESCECWKRKA